MYIGGGEAVFMGKNTVSIPGPKSGEANNGKLTGTCINAVDGVAIKAGNLVSDGYSARSYLILKNPRLYIFQKSSYITEAEIVDGQFSLMLSGGTYECLVALTGFEAYFNDNCKIFATNTTELKIVLSSILMPGQARIVLTWGKEPKDLDSHTIVPSLAPNGATCDVSWNSKVCNGGHIQLDLDATKGMGPETQTIKEFDAGQYVYYVVEVIFETQNNWSCTVPVFPLLIAFLSSMLAIQKSQAGVFQMLRCDITLREIS
uniref:Uncharacterized protein n=1 Tax=Cryptomonas curvata TaxID=233186 RepID=A0A7S0N5M1_9CRYP|mmetsp:Transcript_60662/g.127067  ORF Transcript_60662/g.127067 Transcript_60662/m.127067 type:complete len:260 (+) Transcript_60662:822-1601(+)